MDRPEVRCPWLEPGEVVLASFVSDVSPDRQFRETWVVLTTQRLCWGQVSASSADAAPAKQAFAADGPTTASDGFNDLAGSWPIAEIQSLKIRDRSGLGLLDVLAAERRLAQFPYTLGRANGVLILVDQFARRKDLVAVSAAAPPEDIPEAEAPPPAPNTLALFRLWEFARPQIGWILVALALSFGSTSAGFVPSLLTGPLVDNVLKAYEREYEAAVKEATAAAPATAAQDGAAMAAPVVDRAAIAARVKLSSVPWYLGGMLGAAVLTWLLAWGQGALLAYVSERTTADLRNRTYSHLQHLSLEYFGGKRTGDLMSRIGTDSDRLTAFLGDSLVDFIADLLLVVMTITLLFYRDPWLAAGSLAPFPLIAWVMYKSRDSLQTGFGRSSRAWANLTSVLADTIPGIRVVKAFAQEEREITRFRAANREVIATNDRVNFVWTFFWPLIAFLNQLGVLVVWSLGVWRVYEGQLTVGDLFVFYLLVQRFYGRLEMMSRMVNASQRAAASAQRIFEVLDRVSSVPEPAHPVNVEQCRGELEFRSVGFRYGNRKVMHDLALKIAPGEMIGLVGHTGAGKSTLINLVCRFFDVAEGAILLDGHDIRSYRINDYRRQIGIVLQEPFLFFGTIAENIAYGRPETSREEIIAAAKAARCHDFILQLPDGYDSLVGERGQSLSGGERQRISIARALLIDPRILILDEATSAVDTETEREIQAALAELVKGRTTIAIAHRLSTLRQANRIVVLERGRIVEVGTHDQLLKQPGGAYRKLHDAQQQLTQEIAW